MPGTYPANALARAITVTPVVNLPRPVWSTVILLGMRNGQLWPRGL